MGDLSGHQSEAVIWETIWGTPIGSQCGAAPSGVPYLCGNVAYDIWKPIWGAPFENPSGIPLLGDNLGTLLGRHSDMLHLGENLENPIWEPTEAPIQKPIWRSPIWELIWGPHQRTALGRPNFEKPIWEPIWYSLSRIHLGTKYGPPNLGLYHLANLSNTILEPIWGAK